MKKLFIFGAQRSGTSILSSIIGEHPNVKHYAETNVPINKEDYKEAGQTIRLKELNEVQEIFNNLDEKYRLIVCKPLVESQNADKILNFFEDSFGLWSFRNYKDVISSNITKWPNRTAEDFFKVIINRNENNWRSQGLTHNCYELFNKFYNPDMSIEESVALMWLMRNQLYFDQGLEKDSRISLVSYERLVSENNYIQNKIDEYINGIEVVQKNHRLNTESLMKGSYVNISSQIDLACQEMYERLVRAEKSEEFILKGKGFHLFLKKDKHDVLNYFTGKKPSEVSINNFWNNIKSRSDYCQKLNIDYQHYIFPDKIYSLRSNIDRDIISLYKSSYELKINAEPVNFIEFNLEEAEDCYLRGDTHLSAKGNEIALSKMIIEENYIEKFKIDKVDFIKAQKGFVGDLSSKLTEKITEVKLNYVNPNVEKHTNGLVSGNNGIIDIYVNETAIWDKKLLIFGDSFFRNMLNELSYFYSEIIFCRTPFFHYEVVERCSPDVVFTGNAERYLSFVNEDKYRNDFFLIPLINRIKDNPSRGFISKLIEIFDFSYEHELL